MLKLPVSRDLNFASRDYRLSSRLVLGLIAASVLLLALAAVQVGTTLSCREQREVLDRQASDLTARNEKLRPVLEERERLLRDLNTMSGLIEARKFFWTGLLTRIEEVFPVGAALERFQYDPKNRSLVLEGRARSPEALRNLLAGLEKSPSFGDPLLKHQTVEKGVISFTVGANYR